VAKLYATLAALYVTRSMFDEAESSCQHAIEILEKSFARLPVSGAALTPMPLYYRKRTEKPKQLLETRAMTYSAKFHEGNNAK